eukprot:14610-Chlamydomonas_euryale.AAC.1
MACGFCVGGCMTCGFCVGSVLSVESVLRGFDGWVGVQQGGTVGGWTAVWVSGKGLGRAPEDVSVRQQGSHQAADNSRLVTTLPPTNTVATNSVATNTVATNTVAT